MEIQESESLDSLTEKEQMRRELEEYLREFKEKKDENGQPLVHFPSNFDSIVDAMGRKDLNSNETNSWSKYLFQSKLDEMESSSFEDGRYKTMMAELNRENEYRKGMAEIQLLDKQLGKLNRKARDIKLETAELELAGSGNMDSTFVTRLITPGGKSTTNSSRQTSPQSTARSRKSSRGNSKQSQRDRWNDDDSLNEEESGNHNSKDSPQQEEKEEKIPETEEDIARELRLKLLLEDDTESNEAWQDILRYGYTEESKKRIDEIDAKLAQFEEERRHHLQDAGISLNEPDISDQSSHKLPALVPEKSNQNDEKEVIRPEKVIGDSYLKEQKMATVRKKYSQQLDLLLSLVHSKMDLTGLLEPTALPLPPERQNSPSSGSSFLPKIRNIHNISQSHDQSSAPSATPCSSTSRSPSIYQITPINSLNPNRVITMADVQSVVQELCYSPTSSSTSANPPVSKSSRGEIDRLLASLREETNELSELRSRGIKSNTRIAAVEDIKESKSYSEKLQEYYQKMKYHDNDEDSHTEDHEDMQDNDQKEEILNKSTLKRDSYQKSIDLEERTNGRGVLSRMSTLELKNSKDNSKKEQKGKPLKPKLTNKNMNQSKIDPAPAASKISSATLSTSSNNSSSSSSSSLSNIIGHPTTTSGLVSDLEALHHKMNSILSRATHVTKQEEDESDIKMRQLLEEIYSVPSSSYDEDYLHSFIGEETNEGQYREEWMKGSEGIDDERDNKEDVDKVNDYEDPSVLSSETKGIF